MSYKTMLYRTLVVNRMHVKVLDSIPYSVYLKLRDKYGYA